MGTYVLVEEDPILRTVPVILDPATNAEHQDAVIEWFRHDVPDFVAWREALRARIPGLFPAEVVFADGQEDFLAKLGNADAVVIEALAVGEPELDAAPRLKSVLRFGAQPGNIDLEACRRRGVQVDLQRRHVNVAVAEHAMACMLALAKRLPETGGLMTAESLTEAGFDVTPYDRRYAGNSNFARVTNLGTLSGSTLLVIGFGEIGREIAQRAVGFEMDVCYFQRHQIPAEEEQRLQVRYGALRELLGEADYVSINLPVTAETRGFLGAELLGAMKPGAVLIDVARADLVDRAALLAALDSGHLGGFALDVAYEEPMLPGDPLLGRSNVLLTPHTAPASRANGILDMEEMYEKLWRAVTRA